jgi:hypothetical protein
VGTFQKASRSLAAATRYGTGSTPQNHSHALYGEFVVLFQGDFDVVSVRNCHRSLPNDPHDPNAYSLIPVHVWSRNVSDVVATASYLGSEYFDVVTPEAFVAKLTANVYHNCGAAPAPTGPYSQSCTGGTVNCGSITGARCRADSGAIVTNPFFDYTQCSGGGFALFLPVLSWPLLCFECPIDGLDNCNGRLICLGDACPSSFPSPNGSYSGSCSGCNAAAGFLEACDCAGGDTTQSVFDYTICEGYAVANCYGALICQGQPCV